MEKKYYYKHGNSLAITKHKLSKEENGNYIEITEEEYNSLCKQQQDKMRIKWDQNDTEKNIVFKLKKDLSLDDLERRLIDLGVVLSDAIVLGGSFVLPDGKFVDLHSSYLNGAFPYKHYPTGVHGDIDDIMRNHFQDIIPEELMHVKNILGRAFGAIKLQDGVKLRFERPYMILPQARPTDYVFSQLLSWIYQTYHNQHNHMFLVGFYDDSQRWYRLITLECGEQGMTPEDLILELKKFYNVASNKSWDEAIKNFAEI